MSNEKDIPPGWQANIEALWAKLKIIRTAFFSGFVSLFFLNFAGFIPLWSLMLFMLSMTGIAFYLIYIHIKCPNCGTSPFSKAGLKSGDNCYNCGFKLNDHKDIKEVVAARYQDKRAGDIDWTPLSTASANFDNYKLHIDKRCRLSFKATLGSLFFGGLFLGFGLVFYTLDYIASQGRAAHRDRSAAIAGAIRLWQKSELFELSAQSRIAGGRTQKYCLLLQPRQSRFGSRGAGFDAWCKALEWP